MIRLDIEFKNISFAYHKKLNIINNVNLKFKIGYLNVITGKNGSGKTTLTNLLLGIWHDYEGEILINGVDIKSIEREKLLKVVGVCFQKTPIFADSLEKNIIMDKPKNSTKLSSLLKKVNWHDLKNLKNGLNTLMGADNKLSGGQIQKIGILRALYADTPIIIFDEPTSSLDAKSQLYFIKLLNTIKKNHLIIVISHDEHIIKQNDVLVKF